MMVYANNRSTKLPRAKSKFIKRKPPVAPKNITPQVYRPSDNSQFPSVFMRRCAGGVFRTLQQDRDDEAANSLLDSMINGAV